ncbi:ATP synthase F0 subunit B [bacterium]|jgi:F-type H+-transporting ATPase subunit b|nr:ATP synthase F0 subunit B [bacterium]
MITLLIPALNLFALLAILFFYTRKPIVEFVKTRHSTVQTDLEQVTQQLHQAQEQFEEFSSKLKAIDAEVASMREQAKQDAETMKGRIVSDAKKLSGVILSDAKSTAEAVITDLKSELIREYAIKVLDKAEITLKERLTGDEKKRIQQEFSKQVGGLV